MKKTLLMLLIVLVANLTKAQNGGISNENASLKIEYAGMTTAGETVVRVTNKDTCTSNIRVQWGSHFRTKNVTALTSDTFHLPTQIGNCFIMASSISPCRNRYDGNVEINYCQALPITFGTFMVRRIDPNTVKVIFSLTEIEGRQFYIQLSKDGKNFRRIEVVMPENMTIGQIYSVTIKL